MQNFIQSGKVLSLVAPAGGVKSGEFVVVGGLHGFAIADAAEGAVVSVSREGVFSAPKAGIEIHQGDPLFWDPANEVFTTVAQDDPIRAIATEHAAAGSETVTLVLVPPLSERGEGDHALRADLASNVAGKGASMIGIEDAEDHYEATTVEGVLADLPEMFQEFLASTEEGEGSDAIGVVDAGGKFTATTLTGVLMELEARIAALESA